MYVCAHIGMCRKVCVYASVFICMWRPEVKFVCDSSGAIHLVLRVLFMYVWWIHTVNTVLLGGFILFLLMYECIRGVCAYLHACECNISVCAYMCTCMERPRLAMDIFLDRSPLYVLR